MTATSALQRRWRRIRRWAGGLFGLLLVAMVAYAYRPLNAVERQFLGTWRLEDDLRQPPILVTYHANRTLSSRSHKGVVRTGSWSAWGDQLAHTIHVPVLPTWWDRLKWIPQRYDLWLTQKPMRIVELTEERLVFQYADGTKHLADGTQERYVRWKQDSTNK